MSSLNCEHVNLPTGCSLGRRVAAVALGLILSGCASGPRANPSDPFEPMNRSVYRFNDALDRAVLKPVAVAYQESTPELVRKGVGNFFGNLQDAWSFVNNVLQLKGEAAGASLTRFWVNTLMGLGGVLDVAGEMQIPRYTEDFGQTLGHWGVGAGPYIVLPLLGPSSLRDAAALPVDWRGDPVARQDDVATRNTLLGVRVIHDRASVLRAERILEQAALDKYSFVRDAYLQSRQNAVYDGEPPDEPRYDEEPPANGASN